ncbi:helix-turn-helix domain-containing protein [Glycomyces artemisiae]|uniref:Transcriptional regulator with XRE-family HTH domain n=1 Tax=Glycomyces artemisiae TaxID=1076443 RepID=A0A2T0UF38_9ACTN|nr:helix-turn-helix transcriptional regulator [Glycomyces artemisiae]PRY56484.1 transcriptional regulator with XRE-family HTH domain [Glycomyces artemisiae]
MAATTKTHGPDRCHLRYCTAAPCVADGRSYKAAHQRYRTRMLAYGRWDPFVDAQPVRDHVAMLRAAGIGIDQIPRLTGMPRRTLIALVRGVGGRPPSRLVRSRTAEKVLAVTPGIERCAPGARVDPTGTRRRLRALQAVGWSQQQLADRMGTSKTVVGRMIRGENGAVLAASVLKVRALYEELWDQAPPGETSAQRQAVTRARRDAAALGYVPPLAWDEETIDDPAAEPSTGSDAPATADVDEVVVERALAGHPVELTVDEVLEVVRIGTASGLSAAQIAKIAHISSRSVVRIRNEQRLTEAVTS